MQRSSMISCLVLFKCSAVVDVYERTKALTNNSGAFYIRSIQRKVANVDFYYLAVNMTNL